MGETVKDFQSETEKAFNTAFKSAKGGDESWNAFLALYAIQPLSGKEKESILNSGMKISTGAFPIELRRVLQAIIHKHAVLAAQDPLVLNLIQGFNVDAEVIRYHNRIKPFGGMSDVFKNAKTSTKNYSAGIGEARKSAIRCKNCGAPRLEEKQDDECLFCGSELFEPTP